MPVGGSGLWNLDHVHDGHAHARVEGVVATLRRRERRRNATETRGGIWLTYLAGAAAGAFSERSLHSGAIAIPVALTAAVALAAIRAARRPSASRDSAGLPCDVSS
jgi:uncharacterized membrane protein YoaK (UPF0700 family)